MKISRALLAGLCLISAAQPAVSSTTQDEQAWVNLTVMGTLTGQVVYFAEVQPRFGDGVSRLDQLLLRPAVGVKLSTPRRGCSGLAYSVDYVTEADPFDEKIETPGGTFYVDGGSLLYLVGSTMDWVEDDFTAGFVFQNPNAKGMCGCGESFTV